MTKWNAPRELMGLLSVGLLLLLLPISLHASSSVLTTSEELTELQSDGKKVVKGVVLDDLGEPLPGVGIRIKGMKGAWGTNASGRFEIPVTKERVIMTFSFVGFKTVEQEVKAGAEVTIQLEEDVDLLDEVVVTGYMTKNKSSFTGSQTTVDKKQIMSIGTKNILQSLEAFVPGMVTMENSAMGSNPNAQQEINIRGRATFEGKANMPVFVVDGSIVSSEFVFDMDMNEVESVTVLRDASATALYGAKGSAGVIVITTRALEGGKLKLRYNGTIRTSFPDLSDYHLLNASQKLEYERLAGLYNDANPQHRYELDKKYAALATEVARGVDTDWLAKPLRVGVSQNHNINVDGGDDYARYSLGLRYGKDAGVMKGSGRDRLNFTFNLSYSRENLFFISNLARVSFVNSYDSPYGDFTSFVNANPYDSPYDQTGELRQLLNHNLRNPLYEASVGNKSNSSNFDFFNTTTLRVWLGDFRIDGDATFQRGRSNSLRFVSPRSGEFATTKNLSQRGRLSETFRRSTDFAAKLLWFPEKG